jgi:hypothetical protein
MKPEATVRVSDEVFDRFPAADEVLGPLVAFAVVPVRQELVLADLDDLA